MNTLEAELMDMTRIMGLSSEQQSTLCRAADKVSREAKLEKALLSIVQTSDKSHVTTEAQVDMRSIAILAISAQDEQF